MKVPLINLLPKEERKTLYQKIAHEKAMRFVLLFALCVVIFTSILFIGKLSLNYEKNTLFEQIRLIESGSLMQKVKNYQNEILAFNKTLKRARDADLAGRNLTDQLKKLVVALPHDIILKSVLIEGSKVNIVGFAKTRIALKEFKDTLEKKLAVKEMEFPLSNFESSKNIDFTISYKFNNDEKN